jgi:glyoxylase I family protein
VPLTGFNHYNLRANRALLDALRDFYVDVVGLSQGPRPPFNTFGYWLYIGSDAVLHLSLTRDGEQRPPNIVNTFDHVAFSCVDRPAAEATLQRLGIRYRSIALPDADLHQLFFNDPAGNGVELNFTEPAGSR